MDRMRILAVDVGNTSVFFAEISDNKIVKTYRISALKTDSGHVAQNLRRRFALKGIDAVVIASVVPMLGAKLRRDLPRILGIRTLLIGKDLSVPIQNRYRNPKQVGTDRLVNAYAAYRKHRKACVIIDFGTAITLDAVSSKGEYLGGVIAPGIQISLEALFQKTALLPKIRLKHTGGKLIGRDTAESIRIGCTIGIGGLCDRLAFQIKEALGPKTVVIATGGYAAFMKRYCRSIYRVSPLLTVQGIRLAYLESKKA